MRIDLVKRLRFNLFTKYIDNIYNKSTIITTRIVSKRLRFDLFTKYIDNIYSMSTIK